MSNARSKAEASHAKDIRQGIVEQTTIHVKNRKIVKPYKITGNIWLWEDCLVGRYRTLHDTELAFETYQRKATYTNLKIIGPNDE
jgi:hypothetical protein